MSSSWLATPEVHARLAHAALAVATKHLNIDETIQGFCPFQAEHTLTSHRSRKVWRGAGKTVGRPVQQHQRSGARPRCRASRHLSYVQFEPLKACSPSTSRPNAGAFATDYLVTRVRRMGSVARKRSRKHWHTRRVSRLVTNRFSIGLGALIVEPPGAQS